MIKINRKIEGVKDVPCQRADSTQASINSDGCIVPRNYSGDNEDELLILSYQETESIFQLMEVINKSVNRLPF